MVPALKKVLSNATNRFFIPWILQCTSYLDI
jgi:hypothetical protein